MSTLTPNYGLIVPDGTDTVEQVRADYATNLNKIDGIGGGGSSTLAGLSDVNLTTPVTADALIYDGAEWANTPLSAVAFSGDYNDLLNNPTIPTKVSDLTNDSGFITNTVNNLTNYYLKSETYTQAEINALIAGIVTLNVLVVQSLPTTNISTTTIYLVPKTTAGTQDVYDEYLNLDGTTSGWEHIGTTEIDLSNYYTKTQVDTLLSDKVDKVSGKGLSTEDYTTAEKNKLAGIASGAEVNVQSDWNQSNNAQDDYIKNKPTKLSDFTNDSGFITGVDVSDIGDVDLNNLANGQVLKYNSTSQKWENQNESGGGGSYTEGDGIDITNNTISVDTTFTEAQTRTNIASGDTFATILGKIKKWFTDIPNLFVDKTGDTMTGELQVNRNGEVGVRVVRANSGTSIVKSTICAGNNIPDGTTGATFGNLTLYGDQNRYAELQARNVTANRAFQFPNKSGTIAITDDIPDVSGKVNKSGDTMTGGLQLAGMDLTLGTTGSSSDDSGDLVYTYGNGNEKARIWTENEYTAGVGPLYRVNKSDGTQLYYGRLATMGEVDGKVSKSGDTMTGALVINRNSEAQATFSRQNTGTSSAVSNITLGNGTADGTAGSTYGRVRIYGKGAYRTDLQAPDSTANRTITLPNKGGTVALTSDIPDISGKVNKSGDTMSGSLKVPELGVQRGSYTEYLDAPSGLSGDIYVTLPDEAGMLAIDGNPQPTKCPRVESKNLNNSSSIHDGNSMAKFTECGPSCTNLPDAYWYFIMSFDSADSNYGAQLAIGMTTDSCWVRRKDGGGWRSWRRLI